MNFSKIIKSFIGNPVFYILLVVLYLLPFLDGGTSFLGRSLIFLVPLPLFLLGLLTKSLNFGNLPKKIIWFWLAFLGVAVISTIFSASQLLSIPELFRLFAYFLFFVLFLLTARPGNMKAIFFMLLLASFALCVWSFICLLPGTAKPSSGMNLMYATFGHNHLADLLLLFIPFLIALFFSAKGRKRTVFWGCLTVFYLLSFALTFSRGAFLVLPLAVLFLLFLIKPESLVKKVGGWMLVWLPIGLFTAILLLSRQPFLVEMKIVQPGNWLLKQTVKPDYDAGRTEYFRQALLGFQARPIFGFGPGTFEIIAFRFQNLQAVWSNYAHNFYLQILAEEGILAFLFFISFLFFGIRESWKRVAGNRDNPFVVGALAAILSSSLHSALDFDWHFPAIFLIFLLLLANLLPFSNKERLGRSKVVGRLDGLGKYGVVVLSFLVFLFGQAGIVSEYYYAKGDYKESLIFSPWPPVRVREEIDKIFTKRFSEGEKLAKIVLTLSKNDPSMYSWLGDKYFNNSEPEKAAEFYRKSIAGNPLGNLVLYKRLVEIYRKSSKEEEKEKLYQFLTGSLKNKVFKDDNSMAKFLYSIGEEYLQEGRTKEAVFLWDQAKNASSQWSYFHLELASLYYSIAEKDKAKEVLLGCLRFKYPREHCWDFISNKSENMGLEPPGFWKEKITAIPEYK